MNINVVLVRPLYPSNIGATARAMDNFGLERLIIIDRKSEINSKAKQAASNAQRQLENRIEYGSWDEFYASEGNGLRIAMTAREGKMRQVEEFYEFAQSVKTTPELKELSDEGVYLFFGQEDCGLAAEDLKLMHHCCYLQTYGDNFSLNLAQAVLLTLSQARQSWGGGKTRVIEQSGPTPKAAYFPEETIQKWITSMGMQIDGKVNAHEVFRRMLLRGNPTRKELNNLETLLQQTIRKLEERSEYQKKFGPLDN
jgi:tRNA/rRNA methyltransferase